MYASSDEAVAENRLDYLHATTKIVLTADVQRLSFGGKTYEDLKKGTVLNVWNWVAEVLVSKGYAEHAPRPSLANQLMQVEWREKNNPADLQPLPKHFYAEVSSNIVADDYAAKKFMDIVTMRMMKIVSIAAKRLEGEIVRKMTPEEEVLYRNVFRVVDDWVRAVLSGRGGVA
ncbi:MAG: hypothetical protein RMI43_01730 [Candidatus Caldarchaeum sp.]|nr:DNA replication complex GINS family protein [Candidatus Caldarchaeum sp.]MCS7133706.1 DNA replication complex GINS family protein [Candidatus Caldarchaeum sp.]MCX8200875.1 DNA replication complex GINS family protein [Candidatus Caldarchaeum sp.]MDW8062873.1 hypothetical protein [Candidatus Caldarchaeum sp.]MDW8435350.1 hypothetical protein [Candidatus Caldarchaeum sp.]